jgi:hypothetical protein
MHIRFRFRVGVPIVASVAAVVVAVALSSLTALAYSIGSGSGGSAPANPAPGVPFAFKATFVQSSGAPYPAGTAISFSQTGGPTGALPARRDGMVLMARVQSKVLHASCAASFSPPTANTDASGAVSTSVTLPCAGQYTLAATASDGNSVSSTVNSGGGSAGAAPSGGLPNTSADPPAPAPWLPIAGGLLVLTMIGSGIWLRTRARRES